MELEKLFKILLSNKPSKDIIENEKEIFDMIPELEICKGFDQNNEWHIYDVYEHILHVVDNIPNNLTLRIASLFHDIGKPPTYKEDENGVGHFYGHWEISQTIFEEFAKKYKLDKNITSTVSSLIYYHDINLSKISDEEVQKICDIFGTNGIKMLYKLKRADLLAQNEKFHFNLKRYDEEEAKLLSICKSKNIIDER